MAKRVFYITQGSLRVYSLAEGSVRQVVEFSDDDEGLREFDRYLIAQPDVASAMLLDVIEEEFALDTIPKLSARDRAALILRRCERKFRRTPYRNAVVQGKAADHGDVFSVLYSGISNHELIDSWLQIIMQYKTPLIGIYSVPQMAPAMIRKLYSGSGNVMFIAPHQGKKVRQVFMQGGALRSARLSQGPGIEARDYPKFIITEAIRSRRYLERTRMLGNLDVLEVCLVADKNTAERIRSLSDNDSAIYYHFVDPVAAAGKLGCRKLQNANCFEEVFIAALLKQTPKHSYANSGENRYWIMHKMRNALMGGAVVTAAVCSIFAAALITDAVIMENRISEIQSQVKFLAETFRRENEKFDPIKADSYEMQLAVDTGDYLLANRVPAPWVMNQLGAVLGDYPDIQLRELSWSTEAVDQAAPEPRRRTNEPIRVSISETAAVSAVLTAEIMSFDGDMRRAFSRIDQLANDLAARSAFSDSQAIEYPFDANTSAAISGEIGREGGERSARFKIRVTYAVPGAPNRPRSNDEST